MALSRVFTELNLAAVPHGFRSSFRDWAAEETDHPREVVEAAYACSDLFDRRRRVMNDWAAYLADPHRPIAEPAEHEIVGSAAP